MCIKKGERFERYGEDSWWSAVHLETTDFPSSAREEPVDTGQIKVHRGFEAIGEEGMVGVVWWGTISSW